MHRQGKLHGNADALSQLPKNVGESNIHSDSDTAVSVIVATTFLPVYSPQDI